MTNLNRLPALFIALETMSLPRGISFLIDKPWSVETGAGFGRVGTELSTDNIPVIPLARLPTPAESDQFNSLDHGQQVGGCVGQVGGCVGQVGGCVG